ncbi:cytochrome P450 [Whalleya microplaca]|nr:cytochrome P450 [Whalleya microplaca]
MADSNVMRLSSLLFANRSLPWSFVLVLVSLVGSYIVANAIYSLTLHPLADIPGPKLCAISRIPYWLVYVKGRDIYWMHKLHNRYGPVVRFGPTDLSYITAEAWRDINAEKGGRDNEKAQEVFVQPMNGVPSVVGASKENHTRVRRLFSPAFSERAIRKQEVIFQKYVDILMYKLHEHGGGEAPLEMTGFFNFTTFDVMADLCFGRPLGLLAKNEFNPWVRAVFEALEFLPFASMIGYYPLLKAVVMRFEPKWLEEQRTAFGKYAADLVDQRLQDGSDKPDFWNLVMAAQGSDKGLSLDEMHSNADLFMMAGSETTATLLSGLTYYLLVNPDKMEYICEEIRGKFSSTEQINLDSIAHLKYTNACIKEALRIYPPAPASFPRVISDGGHIVLGRWIPPKTRVSVSHYATYHSETNFKNPETFAPERWLGDPIYAGDIRDAHQPFSWGSRNCLGQNMAMHEMRLILVTMLFTFDLELCEESRNWPDQRACALWLKNPLMCRLKPVAR